MELKNKTMVQEFIVAGLTIRSGLQISFLTIYVLISIVALTGNVFLIALICINQQLHTPMYFFLWNLSVVEAINVLNVSPVIVEQIFSAHTLISKRNCLTQCYFYFYLATNVFFILPIMSYDRYLAVSKPLHYTMIMNSRFCIQLMIASWLGSFLCLLYPTILLNQLPYCGSNIINHFFCDSFSVSKLACTDTTFFRITCIISALVLLVSSLVFTVVSYIFIVSTVLQIPSASGRKKTFSTCSSHLTLVSISYGLALFVEVTPALNNSVELYKALQMSGGLISNLMNPFIYTFRNREVKKVLRKHTHG